MMRRPCDLKPSKIVALGLNYRDHAEEFKVPIPAEPILFIKPSTSVIHDGEAIVYPRGATRVDFEAELAIVIGRQARNVPAERAREFIEGYTCLNDVTERNMQGRDGQWTRAKGFDTFCPIGPEITDEVDPSCIDVRSFLNGELKQHSNTKNLIFGIGHIVEFVSGIMTLFPGDVIATGTPSGVGPMQPGDEIVIEIEGIGRLRNRVAAAD
jgi:2-keto-4-pentenoate hydratase/2-oxohepta-3-ene-1,7-dioic acid hydratase in catechol pathway